MCKYTVLVEDDVVTMKLLERRLTKEGFKLMTFLDPVKAKEWIDFNSKQVLVLITDIKMPKLNGMALLAALKEYKFPKMVLSAYGNIAFKGHEFELYDSFLQKPLVNTDQWRFFMNNILELSHGSKGG